MTEKLKWKKGDPDPAVSVLRRVTPGTEARVVFAGLEGVKRIVVGRTPLLAYGNRSLTWEGAENQNGVYLFDDLGRPSMLLDEIEVDVLDPTPIEVVSDVLLFLNNIASYGGAENATEALKRHADLVQRLVPGNVNVVDLWKYSEAKKAFREWKDAGSSAKKIFDANENLLVVLNEFFGEEK